MGLQEIKEKIPEMDIETGLEFCADDEEFYWEMLGDYASDEKSELLNRLYSEKNWGGYELEVHSLKSTSRMMGFVELGDMCEELQKAAGAKDESTIMLKHGPMMDRFTRYIEIIQNEIGL